MFSPNSPASSSASTRLWANRRVGCTRRPEPGVLVVAFEVFVVVRMHERHGNTLNENNSLQVKLSSRSTLCIGQTEQQLAETRGLKASEHTGLGLRRTRVAKATRNMVNHHLETEE